MKTIAIIDPFWRGHHPTYMKLFSRMLLSQGHQVAAITPNPRELTNSIKGAEGKQRDFEAFEIQEPIGPPSMTRFQNMNAALNRWRAVRAAIEKAATSMGRSPDLVFFAWLDSYVGNHLSRYWIDRHFPYPWSGLYFHPRHLRLGQRFSPIRKGPLDVDDVLKSDTCRSVAVLDEGIAARLQTKLRKKSVIVFPDVVDDSPADPHYEVVDQIGRFANGRKKIGIIGGLTKRKGLLPLMKIAKNTPHEDWLYIFAGCLVKSTFSDSELATIDAFVKNPPPNCFFYFSYIPNEPQFNALVKTCDLLYAVYDDFPHSSNILGKAALFNKPVIVANGFCMGERVKNFHLGLQVDAADVPKTIESIRSLLNDADGTAPERKPDFDGYRTRHSLSRLSAAFSELIELSVKKTI